MLRINRRHTVVELQVPCSQPCTRDLDLHDY
jgi:hypothetical protein